MFSIQSLPHPTESDLVGLAELLRDSVAGGASVNFIRVPSLVDATQWWRSALADERNLLFVARDETARIIGCVRLMPAPQENATHRAEIGKLLVLSSARGQGVATHLMQTLETAAAEMDRWLLHLDTETGSYAESFYRKHGWKEFGRFEEHTISVQGVPVATTYFYKNLNSAGR